MPVKDRHPKYIENERYWVQCEDTFEGEARVKEKGSSYLPMTAGQIEDGAREGMETKGYRDYASYKTRAIVPDFHAQAVEAMIGIMHHKEPIIKLPAKMEPLRNNAGVHGETLLQLLRAINQEQLITGRVGLLADVETGSTVNDLPYLALYRARNITNWDDGPRSKSNRQNLRMVTLNETESVREHPFTWTEKIVYRVLSLGDISNPEGVGEYNFGIYEDGESDSAEHKKATFAGNTLNQIPFVIINSKDLVADPEKPPLLGLSNLCLSMYRNQADYQQALYLQGQDTLVIIGGIDDDEDIRAGAGAKIGLTIGGDAKYIGASSLGLPEMRLAIENGYKEAADIGGKLLDGQGRDAESGSALHIRVAARTATLNQIALTASAGLEESLKIIAKWIGENPEEVSITPNLDFADEPIDGQELTNIMSAKTMGLPLSRKSVHATLKQKGYTNLEYEQEMQEITDEGVMIDDLGTQSE